MTDREGVMAIYQRFARIYAGGDYREFSRRMCEHLPGALKALRVSPNTVLDLACGEGTFAVAATELGYSLTGLDLSEDMLGFAQERARSAGLKVNFVQGDMRSIPFTRGFDLVTCWFDSLNYILEPKQLVRVFEGVARALRKNGLFMFDMNTVYGLAVNWRENPCYVGVDKEDVFEVHRQEYNFETSIATMHITAFTKEAEAWTRIDEDHQERAYTQREIHDCLKDSGFQVLASWGSFRDRSEPTSESGRIWYVAKNTIP
jgi:ubiquinone/menaquinone biosynthesis C-methylase UbiE